jgi:hypothetical protein
MRKQSERESGKAETTVPPSPRLRHGRQPTDEALRLGSFEIISDLDRKIPRQKNEAEYGPRRKTNGAPSLMNPGVTSDGDK